MNLRTTQARPEQVGQLPARSSSFGFRLTNHRWEIKTTPGSGRKCESITDTHRQSHVFPQLVISGRPIILVALLRLWTSSIENWASPEYACRLRALACTARSEFQFRRIKTDPAGRNLR